VRIDSVEPIILGAIATAMLFPWRVVIRRKCEVCGVRRPRRAPCQICATHGAT
jgi:hypothetical protein